MSKILLLSPKINLMEEISKWLFICENDYSKNIVVFPGRRPSHFLRKYIAKKIKKSFIPPQIYSIDDFIDMLYERFFGNNKKITPMDATAIIYELNKKNNIESNIPVEEFIGLSIKIFKDLEELYIEYIPSSLLKNVDSYFIYKISEHIFQRIITMSKIYQKFYTYINNKGFSTRAIRYRAIADNLLKIIKNIKAKRIIFAGFFALTKAEEKIFKGFAQLEKTVMLFQDAKGMKEQLQRLSIDYEFKNDTFVKKSKIKIYSSPDTHGQIFALSNILKDIKNNYGMFDETIAVVLPSSETLFPLLHHFIGNLKQQEYNISMGYPLIRTPLFNFFNCLLDVLSTMHQNKVYIPEYLRFALHPYTKNIYFEDKQRPDITRIIFHSIEDYFINQGKRSFVTLRDIEHIKFEDPDILKNLNVGRERIIEHIKKIHKNTIEKLFYVRNIGEFINKLSQILLYIYENSTASLHPYFHPFAETFLKAFEEIKNSLLSEFSFKDMKGYLNFFKQYISLYNMPFEGTPLKGLQIMGMLETRNLKFRKVFILDVNEGILPVVKITDSLIPNKVRESLKLPTYRDKERLIAYYFDLLLKSSEEITLFYVEDEKKEKSRFIERILWEKELKKDNNDKDWLSHIHYNLILSSYEPKPIKKTDSILKVLKKYFFTASELDVYLTCPLKFYYKYLLRLQKKDQNLEPDKTEIGIAVHNILNDYFRKRIGIVLSKSAFSLEEIEYLTDKYFFKYGDTLIGREYLIKRQVKKRLRELIKDYYIPLCSNSILKTLHVEMPVSYNYKGFKLKGTIDKIEQRNGKTIIIDYKTTSNDSHLKINLKKLQNSSKSSWYNYIGSLQIPFYILLYSLIIGKNPEDITGIYLLLGKRKIDKNIEKNVFNDIKKEFHIIEKIILSLIEEITDPNIAFIPTSDFRKNCPNCIYQYICGTGFFKSYY